MRALVRTDRVRLVEVPEPRGDVVVDIAYAGVCRTDLAVADGKVGKRGVILGHELSGGRLVGKGRARAIAGFDVGELVARELCVRGASHGSFEAAVDWLASRRIAIDDLLAEPRPLDDFAHVLAAARAETHKQMFVCA